MKKKEYQDLTKKTKLELDKKVKELKKEISLTKMNILMGKEKNLKKAKGLRRDLAQVLTLLGKGQEEKKGEEKAK